MSYPFGGPLRNRSFDPVEDVEDVATAPPGPSVEQQWADRLSLQAEELTYREMYVTKRERDLREMQERGACTIAAAENRANRYERLLERTIAIVAVAIARMERGAPDVVARALANEAAGVNVKFLRGHAMIGTAPQHAAKPTAPSDAPADLNADNPLLRAEVAAPSAAQENLFNHCYGHAEALGRTFGPFTLMWVNGERIPTEGITSRVEAGKIVMRLSVHVSGRRLARMILHELHHASVLPNEPLVPLSPEREAELDAAADKFAADALESLDPSVWEAA